LTTLDTPPVIQSDGLCGPNNAIFGASTFTLVHLNVHLGWRHIPKIAKCSMTQSWSLT